MRASPAADVGWSGRGMAFNAGIGFNAGVGL